MVSAVAIGQIILGDKEDKRKTDILNTGCAVDLAELEGGDLTGGDVSYEFKVPLPTVKTFSAGKGSKQKGGKPTTSRRRWAISTHLAIYRREVPRQDPGLSSPWQTARSSVRRHNPSCACGVVLARRAKGKKARDATKYGRSRTSTKSFFVHRTLRMALAAQLHHAIAIRREIRSRKQQLHMSRIAGGAP